MGYSVGYDENWGRDIGYGVPSICDHPKCNEEIDRGLSNVCGGEPYGGEYGCGLFFCGEHLWVSTRDEPQRCERCIEDKGPFIPKKDTKEWVNHKLTDKSWRQWRDDNPLKVEKMKYKPYISGFEIEA